jgi:hypothetical protein
MLDLLYVYDTEENMDKIPRKLMSPFHLAEPLVAPLKARAAAKGLPLARAYEEAITMWLDAAGGDGKSTVGRVHCPPGMELIPSVPVPAYVHKVLVQELEKGDGWAELVLLALNWWLEAKHKKPRDPAKVERPATPEELKARKLESAREVAKARFERRICPLVCGVVFWHRKPHAEPWQILGLDGPSVEPEDMERAKALYAAEVAEIEAAKAREEKERREREPVEAPKGIDVYKIGGGCGDELKREMEALRAGIPLSSLKPVTPEKPRFQKTRGKATASAESSREGDFC